MLRKKTLGVLLYSLFSVSMLLLAGFFSPANTFGANLPLEITQPRAGLGITNRYYKAYPSLEYNVRLAVIGGKYPYKFSFNTSPTDSSINANTGEISWPNPIESTTPYSISVKVVDSEGTSSTVSWTITVTKVGFRFVDAVNGKTIAQGGTGTITNPWKTIGDLYEGNDSGAKTRKSYVNDFIYFRNGNYYTADGYVYLSGYPAHTIDFDGTYKPLVWLAYPGESPRIDQSAAFIFITGGATNKLYFDGIEFDSNGNDRGCCLGIPSTFSNITLRRSTFHNITTGKTGGTNALINTTSADVQGLYWSIQDNTGYDVNNGYFLLGYDTAKVLVEDNYIYNITGHAISPKDSNRMWFIRHNRIITPTGNGVYVQGYHPFLSMGDIEISYNFIKTPSTNTALEIYTGGDANFGKVWAERNTIVGQVVAHAVTSTNGPVYFKSNVIVNETGYTPDLIKFVTVTAPDRVITSGNLTGNAASNITDSNGSLTTNYLTFLGFAGWQLKGGIQPVFLHPPSVTK